MCRKGTLGQTRGMYEGGISRSDFPILAESLKGMLQLGLYMNLGESSSVVAKTFLLQQIADFANGCTFHLRLVL